MNQSLVVNKIRKLSTPEVEGVFNYEANSLQHSQKDKQQKHFNQHYASHQRDLRPHPKKQQSELTMTGFEQLNRTSQDTLLPYLYIDILDDDHPVVFQGELMKLKPGIKSEYQSKWLQVTSKALRYYKSRWTQNSVLQKPLSAIPLAAIHKIQILEPDVQREQTHTGIKKKFYKFELVLKEDFLDLYLDPYYDVGFNEDKTKLQITLEKKRKELSSFQELDIDYFTSHLYKPHLIEMYMSESSGRPSVKKSTLQLSPNCNSPREDDNMQQVVNESRLDSTLIGSKKNVKAKALFTPSKEPRYFTEKQGHSSGTKTKNSTQMSDRDSYWFLTNKRLMFGHEDETIFKEWVRSFANLLKSQK